MTTGRINQVCALHRIGSEPGTASESCTQRTAVPPNEQRLASEAKLAGAEPGGAPQNGSQSLPSFKGAAYKAVSTVGYGDSQLGDLSEIRSALAQARMQSVGEPISG